MGYERLSLKAGEVLMAKHLEHFEDELAYLDQKVYEQGGSWNKINNYVQPTDINEVYRGNCLIEIDDTGWTQTRNDLTAINSSGVCQPLGAWGEIKNRTYNFIVTDAGEEADSVIVKTKFYITLVKDYNFNHPKIDLSTDNYQNVKKFKFTKDFSTIETDYSDDDLVYLVTAVYVNTPATDISVTRIECWYVTEEFIEGATGTGEFKDAKYYYTASPTSTAELDYTVTEDNKYIFTPKENRTLGYNGCVIPLELWQELKTKKIGIVIKDLSNLGETPNFRLQLNPHKDFNINYPGNEFCSGRQALPYTQIVDVAALGMENEDSTMMYLLFYCNFSNLSTAPTLEVSLYELRTEWVETPVDLSGYYTKEEVEELVSAQIAENAGSTYSDYTLYSIGDSLCAGGGWQEEVALRLGCQFDQSFNGDPSHPTSIGGTNSNMSNNGSTFFRTMNLINYGNIKKQGDKAIILLENVNDGAFVFDSSARVYKLDQVLEMNEISSANLAAIDTSKRNVNTAIKLLNVAAGKVLTIDSLPTKEGDITLRIGWAGPGVSSYNVHVVPQSTDEATRQYIYDRIIEYDFKGVYDEPYDSNGITGVSFCSGQSAYLPTVEFKDTDSTGMTVTITEVTDTTFGSYYWFDSDDISNWTDTSYWKVPSTSSGWKSSIEALIRALPKAKIGILNLPRYGQTQADYLKDNGTYDEVAFYNDVDPLNKKYLAHCQEMADLYRIKCLDVYSICGISASNLTTFYPAKANVHPLAQGYVRWGEIVAGLIQGWLTP